MSEMKREVIQDAEDHMKQSVKVFDADLQGFRTGRASTALVEKLQVEYYGAPTPIIQLAGISVPDPQTIMISPYDRNTLSDIERAILASDLGMTPNNDGSVIRLNVPALTTDRRKEIAKQVGKRLETTRVSIRNIRRSALEDIKELQGIGEISEDEMHGAQDDIQKLTDKYIKQAEESAKRKEKEILEG